MLYLCGGQKCDGRTKWRLYALPSGSMKTEFRPSKYLIFGPNLDCHFSSNELQGPWCIYQNKYGIFRVSTVKNTQISLHSLTMTFIVSIFYSILWFCKLKMKTWRNNFTREGSITGDIKPPQEHTTIWLAAFSMQISFTNQWGDVLSSLSVSILLCCMLPKTATTRSHIWLNKVIFKSIKIISYRAEMTEKKIF